MLKLEFCLVPSVKIWEWPLIRLQGICPWNFALELLGNYSWQFFIGLKFAWNWCPPSPLGEPIPPNLLGKNVPKLCLETQCPGNKKTTLVWVRLTRTECLWNKCLLIHRKLAHKRRNTITTLKLINMHWRWGFVPVPTIPGLAAYRVAC